MHASPKSGPSGLFLVAETRIDVAQTLSGVLEQHRPVIACPTWEDIQNRFAGRTRWTGMVVSCDFDGGRGLELLALARKRLPLLPILVLSDELGPVGINRAFELRAEIVAGIPPEGNLERFAREAVRFERVPGRQLSHCVQELAQQCDLTPRETELVSLTVARVSRDSLQRRLGVSANTVKSQVRSVLRKTGHESLHGLSKSLLRTALCEVS